MSLINSKGGETSNFHALEDLDFAQEELPGSFQLNIDIQVEDKNCLIYAYFLISIAWSFGGTLRKDSKEKFALFLAQLSEKFLTQNPKYFFLNTNY
jgi:hypothetical protein